MSESSKVDKGSTRTYTEEINAARHAVMVMARAIKNRSIYPREHSGIMQMMQSAMKGLQTFSEKFGPLRLNVTRHALLYRDETVLEAEHTNDPVVHPMYRDGVIWVEFMPGIEQREFELFVDLLIKHRKPEEEAKTTLVTSLWESDLPHLAYEAVDPDLETTPPLDISVFKIISENASEKRAEILSSPAPATPPALSLPEHLSDYDRHSIRHMIEEEAILTRPEDILDVLLILLVNQNSEQEFQIVLKSLVDTFAESLARGEFVFCARCLRSIQNLIRKTEHKSKWRWRLLGRFMEQACSVSAWEKLAAGINDFHLEPKDVEAFNFLIRTLPEQIMEPAARLLTSARDEDLRRILVESIALHAKAHPELLVKLLKELNADAVLELLEVLERLEDEHIKPVLMELSKHRDAKIRARAVWMLTRKDPNAAMQLFALIDDPEPAIRKQILLHLGNQRSPTAEDLLLKYLNHQKSVTRDKGHILACYQALGRCGSSHSLAFLEEMLFDSPWKDTLNRARATHRKGAASALALLATPESKRLLRKGLYSLAPNIRKACRAAMAEADLKSSTKGTSNEQD